MKVLHTVESYLPERSGMSEVVSRISERLAKSGHEIHVATKFSKDRNDETINDVKVHQFKCDGNLVKGIKGETDKYRNFILENKFDIVTNFAAQCWTTDLCLDLLARLPSKKVFVPTGFSAYYLPSYWRYYSKMKNWMRDYDISVFLSEDYRDINFARKNHIDKITVIPNGAEESEFLNNSDTNIREKFNLSENDFLILHVGTFTGLKGHIEAAKIFDRANINNAVLMFIGDKVSGKLSYRTKKLEDTYRKINNKNNSKKIIITSATRAETVAAFKEADLFLFPSNIECSPIVLFEAMASRTPFMATDVGNSFEIASWSQSGIIFPTIKIFGFSRALINLSSKLLERLFSDSEKRAVMKEEGYKAWSKNFTWEIIAKKYLDLYTVLLKIV